MWINWEIWAEAEVLTLMGYKYIGRSSTWVHELTMVGIQVFFFYRNLFDSLFSGKIKFPLLLNESYYSDWVILEL